MGRIRSGAQAGPGKREPFSGKDSCKRSRERGITLLESLISSLVLCLLAAVVLVLYVQVEREMQQVQEAKQLEVEARSFFMYVEEELRRSDRFETPTSYVLCFRDDAGGTIMYWMTGNRLCRQVNGTGYVVMLQYVSRVKFTVFPNGCQIYIELTKGGESWKGEVFIAKRVELAV